MTRSRSPVSIFFRALLLLASTVCIAASPPGPPILLLGEVHDNRLQHERRLAMFTALLDTGARPALLMEQFDRERQPDIDRLRAGKAPATADDLIALAGQNSGWNWDFYRPFIALALRYDLPIIAANVSRDDTRKVVEKGLAAGGFDARVPPAIERSLATEIEATHCGMIDAALARRMTGAQVARDQFMARMIEGQAGRGVVLLAGNGHVRIDSDVPYWLSPAIRARTTSIGFLEEGDDSQARYDRVVVTAAQPRDDPCAAMRSSAGMPR